MLFFTSFVSTFYCFTMMTTPFAWLVGSQRNVKFSEAELSEVELALWNLAKEHPCWSLDDTTMNQNNNRNINNSSPHSLLIFLIRKIFQNWRWSWKKTDPKQPQKYTLRNLTYTIEFALWVRTVPLTKLKFLDESHFNSSGIIF